MRDELSATSQSYGIDAVWLKDVDGQIRNDGHNHQWHEQVVAAGEFGDEENACEGSVHHTRHEACHAVESTVFWRKEAWAAHGEPKSHVPDVGEKEPCYAAHEQAGGEHSTASASAIGGCGGKHLQEKHQTEVDEQVAVIVVEKGVVHDFLFRGFVDELVNHIITFTIHGREEIDEDTQHNGSEQEFITFLLDFPKDFLHPVHGSGEVEADKTAGDAQHDAAWDDVDGERLVEAEIEQGGCAVECIRHTHRSDAGDEQRQQ